jgi:hypothetical protein
MAEKSRTLRRDKSERYALLGPFVTPAILLFVLPEQAVDVRKLDVSNASKETCNLCQPTFVGLYLVSEPSV